MRTLFFGLGGILFAAVLISGSNGQTPSPPPNKLPAFLPAEDIKAPPSVQPVNGTTTPVVPTTAPPAPKPRVSVPFDRFRNLDSVPNATRPLVITALTGMEWLHRYHQPNGLFLYGYLPGVGQPLEGDHILHQTLATFTLARAARFSGDDRYAVRANQAVLTLLSGTSVDPSAPGIRRSSQPAAVCNRLAAAGCLLMAIHELPEPSPELVQKGEELASFIRQMQREDGALADPDSGEAALQREDTVRGPGLALYGLALSQRMKPADWKKEVLRKSLTNYRRAFKRQPTPETIPWMTAACTEAYGIEKENQFVEFAFEMNDFLCGLQYAESPDPRKPHWRGGFKQVVQGKVEAAVPGLEAALYAQSLADCCRLVRQMPTPDVPRFERYRLTVLRSLQFLTSLQFTDANTMHIAANYRLYLVGGFHPTPTDGNVRIDQGAAGVSAFVQFLTAGLDRTQ